MTDTEYILSKLQENGVAVKPEFEEVFNSHINVLSYRLQNNECVPADDLSFLEQIDADDLALGHQILDPLFEKYNVEMNELEIGLFAIYLKLFKEE